MINKIPFNSLLQDMLNYEPAEKWNDKAYRVYFKCYCQGHLKLAARIYKKYGPFVKSDRVVSSMMGLMSAKSKSGK